MEMGIEDTNKQSEKSYSEDDDILERVSSCPNLHCPASVKPLLLLKDRPETECESGLMNLKIQEYDNCNLKDLDHLTASTSTIYGSNCSLDSQQKHSRSSESEEDTHHKSIIDFQRQCLEIERKWLKYRVDSVTRDEAIIFCILGQMMLTPEDIAGPRERVPSPEEAKQILLVMTYGDSWVLQKLSNILQYEDKVHVMLHNCMHMINWRHPNRQLIESYISRVTQIPLPDY